MTADELAPVRFQLPVAAAILATGAGWIHLLAAGDHKAHPHVAAFFVATAILQLTWAAFVMYGVAGRLLVTGMAGNLGLVLLWAVSRTTGVNFVPGVRHAEPVGIPDAAASGLELLAATALGLLLIRRTPDVPARGARLLVAGAAALTLPLVVAAGLTGTPHHHEHLQLTVHP